VSCEWFVVTNSFAAPFCSDTGERYVTAESAADALEQVAATYSHSCGLFSAAAWPSADAMHKREKPAAQWLCNHEIERKRLTEGLGAYSYLGHGPGDFEIDGIRHRVPAPKAGHVIKEPQSP
jgi:hypothetical protein